MRFSKNFFKNWGISISVVFTTYTVLWNFAEPLGLPTGPNLLLVLIFLSSYISLIIYAIRVTYLNRELEKNIYMRSIRRLTGDLPIQLDTKSFDTVLIFAKNGYKYYQLFDNEEIRIQNVILLVKDVESLDKLHFLKKEKDRIEFQRSSQRLIQDWINLRKRGIIKNLTIKAYDMDAIIHFMLIDGTKLQFGLLEPSTEFPGSNVLHSFVLTNETEIGQNLIKDFQQEFKTISEKFSNIIYN